MTKFDIRLRRKQFTQSRIERHKNYQSLMDQHYEAGKKKTRGIMVLVILIILVIAILLAFFGAVDEPKKELPKDQAGWNMNLNTISFVETTTTIYKL